MIYHLCVPAAVPGVEEIRILEWHAAPGDALAAGDLIVELETHKSVVEVRAGQPGTLREQMAAPGDWRAIGLALAVFSDQPDEPLPPVDAEMTGLAVEFEVV